MTTADPISLAIFIPTLAMGGAEKVAVDLANALTRSGWAISIVLMTDEGALRDSVDAGVRIVALDAGNYRSAITLLAAFYDRERPDVVLGSLYMTDLVAIAARGFSRHKPRVIAGAHNSILFKIRRADNRKDRHLLYPLSRLLFRYADRTIAVSKGIADEIREVLKLDARKVDHVYNPVDAVTVARRSAEPMDHRWLTTEPRAYATIVTVGRLVEQKGMCDLLDALAIVRKSRDVRLIVVGDGPRRADLERQAHDLGILECVDFVGLQRNPYAYVARADLFAFTSRWEGLGNVIIEALACGCPVVATDYNFGAREILDGGRFGILTQVQDPASIASGILAMLDEPETSPLKDKALLMARGHEFSPEAAVTGYRRIISDLMGR